MGTETATREHTRREASREGGEAISKREEEKAENRVKDDSSYKADSQTDSQESG